AVEDRNARRSERAQRGELVEEDPVRRRRRQDGDAGAFLRRHLGSRCRAARPPEASTLRKAPEDGSGVRAGDTKGEQHREAQHESSNHGSSPVESCPMFKVGAATPYYTSAGRGKHVFSSSTLVTLGLTGIASGVLSEELGGSEVAEGLMRSDGVVGVFPL